MNIWPVGGFKLFEKTFRQVKWDHGTKDRGSKEIFETTTSMAGSKVSIWGMVVPHSESLCLGIETLLLGI